MNFKSDPIADFVLNANRSALKGYKFKVDDPLLSVLEKECALTESEIERIEHCVTSGEKMSRVVDYLRQRCSREIFLLFVDCVGSIMKKPDLQRKMLNEHEKGF